MGLAPKMSPNRPRGQILRRFPEPSAKRPPWPKIKGAFWARHLGSRAGIPALICFTRAVLAAPQHGTHCPQAPWPEEQSWLKRKTFSALLRKSCRLNRVVTQHTANLRPLSRVTSHWARERGRRIGTGAAEQGAWSGETAALTKLGEVDRAQLVADT